MKMASARKSLMSRAQTAIFMAVNPGSLWQIVAGLLRFTPQVFAARPKILCIRKHVVWGVNFKRFIRRKNEEDLWSDWRRTVGASKISQAGELHGITEIGSETMPRRDEVEDCPQNNAERASTTTAEATVSRFIGEPPFGRGREIAADCVQWDNLRMRGQKVVPSLNLCQGLFFPIL